MLGLPLRSSNPDLADKKYIAAMFGSGEQGSWYDPSDLSTLFQDAAGTTPVTGVGQPVGLMLDKSKGGPGKELVTNGTFATNVTGWSLADATASITWVNGGFANVKMLANTGSGAFQDVTAAPGIAKVSIRARKVGSSGNTYLEVHARGTLYQKLRGITLTSESFANYEFVVPATNNGFRVYLKVEYAGAEMEVDSVSVRELPGNHATQATTTSRPTLQQDSSGKYYLSFDGVDDYLSTGSINFTGTDKMTVFAGVRKLTDTASGVFVELSADSPTTAGAFVLLSPSSSGANSYKFFSRGSIGPASSPGNGVFAAAPDTSTITCISNISGPEQTLRRNAGLVESSTASQGTGNFGNYPLYIGRRGGASLPFKGHLYGLIVRGAQTDDVHLTHAEKFLAYKSGVSL